MDDRVAAVGDRDARLPALGWRLAHTPVCRPADGPSAECRIPDDLAAVRAPRASGADAAVARHRSRIGTDRSLELRTRAGPPVAIRPLCALPQTNVRIAFTHAFTRALSCHLTAASISHLRPHLRWPALAALAMLAGCAGAEPQQNASTGAAPAAQSAPAADSG